jgi:hypothetical protein
MELVSNNEHLIPFSEAGSLIGNGVSQHLVKKLVASGDLKRVVIGGRKTFITRASIDAYIDRLVESQKAS